MKKSVAIFGLGRFGGTLVREFHKMRVDVIAVDRDEEKVNEYMNDATHIACVNATDETILKQLGVKNVDQAFVSFGGDLQSSILVSLILKEIGVKEVWAKAKNDYHAKILEKIGVDRVIHPERDVAKKIVRKSFSNKMIEFIELSEMHSIVEIKATKKINNCSLEELDIRAKYGCTVIGIQRNGEFIVSPSAKEVVHLNDLLMVMGSDHDIIRFKKVGM